MTTNSLPILSNRMNHLQQKLRENDVVGALIQKPLNLFYYTGSAQPANLWVPVEGEPVLFVRRAYEMAINQSPLKQIYKANSLKDIKKYLLEKNQFPTSNTYIGAEADFLPHNLIEKLKKDFNNENVINITNIIMEQRFVKSKDEIEKIRESAKVWKESHEAILKYGKEGMKEHELAAVFEFEARKNGGDGLVRFHRWDAILPGGGIIASGENGWEISGHAMTVTGKGMSNVLPWGASERKLRAGDLVVADYGLAKKGYHSDMARTYSIGKPSADKKDLWDKLVELHLDVINQIKPGVTGAALYEHALKTAKKLNLENNFMGVNENRGEYLGHSIGLELDEFPVIGPRATAPLPENAVITIEPKFMIPDLGSVMVEDDILITADGYEILGDVPHELFEI